MKVLIVLTSLFILSACSHQSAQRSIATEKEKEEKVEFQNSFPHNHSKVADRDH